VTVCGSSGSAVQGRAPIISERRRGTHNRRGYEARTRSAKPSLPAKAHLISPLKTTSTDSVVASNEDQVFFLCLVTHPSLNLGRVKAIR